MTPVPVLYRSAAVRNKEGAQSERTNALVNGFTANFPQPTWRERMEAYVKSLGFTQKEIDRFRSIMLEEDRPCM
jgi:hypothetical protein